jgi:tagatose 1,6-diphosphate aldolase GatY/KbaY
MSLVTMNSVLIPAKENKYAVPAFNVCNLEFAKTVIETAEEMQAPVIVSLHPIEMEYAGMDEILHVVKSLAAKVTVPVVLHLDHGDSLDTVMKCLVRGFTSVMYDGSHLPFEENIRNTKEIVRIAKTIGVSVEGELGLVGGAEGDNYVHEVSMNTDELTDPEKAVEFVEKTGIDSLAVAIGSAHGLYRGEPKIDVKRLKEINSKISIPLVLHGGSGTPENIIRDCISYGIAKINIASELKYAFYQGFTSSIAANPEEYEPRLFLKEAQLYAKKLICQKFDLFGSSGKAK